MAMPRRVRMCASSTPVEAMRAATDLSEGTVCLTRGFHAAGDGGHVVLPRLRRGRHDHQRLRLPRRRQERGGYGRFAVIYGENGLKLLFTPSVI